MKKTYILSIILISAIIACASVFYADNHDKTKPSEPIETLNNVTAPVAPEVSSTKNISNSQLNEKKETSIPQKNTTAPKATEQDFENAAIMYKDGIISQEEYDIKVNNLKKSISTN